MNNRQNPLFWSFGVGTWAGVHLRISWLMPVVLAWLLYKFNLRMGGAFFGIVFISVLLHEIGHILAARATDGSGATRLAQTAAWSGDQFCLVARRAFGGQRKGSRRSGCVY